MRGIRHTLIIAIFISALAAAITPVIGANEDTPEVFDYAFKNVDPIKIHAGPVTFNHAHHAVDYKVSCRACHHTLEEEETTVTELCKDCHPEPGFIRGKAAEEMAEDELMEHYLNALHAQCIDCHLEKKVENRKRIIPVGCTQCHDRSKLKIIK